MPESEPPEQRNEGPGTFVNGVVHGGLRNIFNIVVSPERRKPSNHQAVSRDAEEHEAEGEEAGPVALFFGAAFLGACGLVVAAYGVASAPVTGWSPHPSLTQRIVTSVLGSAWVIACAACGLARLAQIFSLWTNRAAESTAANAPHYLRIARTNALTASIAARLAHISAVAAALLAAFFVWMSLGRTVTGRAHEASAEATASEAKAWADVRKPRS